MKSRLLLLSALFAFSVLNCLGQVEITSLTQVKIDGQSAGDITAAIVAHPAQRNAILDALEARELAAAGQIQQLQAAAQTAATAHEAALAAKDAEISALQADAQASSTARDAVLAAKDAEISALQSQVTTLKHQFAALMPLLDVVEASALPADHKAALKAARKTEKQRQREALQAEKERITAALEALGPPAP